jgi:hypothetical protein
MDAVTPILTEHGFSLTWKPGTTAGQVAVTCRLAHQLGHHEEATVNAPVDTSGSKSPAQGVASTITLLSRYTALALLGIATADMEEPTPEAPKADPGRVDTERSLRAVGWLKQQGKTRDQAESFLGRKVPDWTAADLERLKSWAKPSAPMGEPGGEEPPIPDEREAGEDG